jgi:hypothetical protein
MEDGGRGVSTAHSALVSTRLKNGQGDRRLMLPDSLTFSIHLLYAIVDFLRSQFQGRRAGGFREVGSHAETELLILGHDDAHVWAEDKGDDQKNGSLEDDLRWPLKGKLWPNWILQLMFIPVLCWVRGIGLSSSHSRSGPL